MGQRVVVSMLAVMTVMVGVVSPAVAADSPTYRDLGPCFEVHIVQGAPLPVSQVESEPTKQSLSQPMPEVKELPLSEVIGHYEDELLLPTQEALDIVAPGVDLGTVVTMQVSERWVRLEIPKVLEISQVFGAQQPWVSTTFPCPVSCGENNTQGRELVSMVIIATEVSGQPAMLIQALGRWQLLMSTGDRSLRVWALNSAITAEQLIQFVKLLK